MVIIRLVDRSFKMVFSDPHCSYSRPTMDLVLIRLVDRIFNMVFSYLHCRYLELEVDMF